MIFLEEDRENLHEYRVRIENRKEKERQKRNIKKCLFYIMNI